MNDRLHSAALAVLPDADSTASRPAAGPAANGARILLDTLIAHGVDTIFGYPGGAVLPLYDALYAEPRLRHVLVRHEQPLSMPPRAMPAAPAAPAWSS